MRKCSLTLSAQVGRSSAQPTKWAASIRSRTAMLEACTQNQVDVETRFTSKRMWLARRWALSEAIWRHPGADHRVNDPRWTSGTSPGLIQEVVLICQACFGVKSRLGSERVVHFPESCKVHEERHRALDIQLEEGRLRRNLTTTFQYVRKGFQQDGAGLLTEGARQQEVMVINPNWGVFSQVRESSNMIIKHKKRLLQEAEVCLWSVSRHDCTKWEAAQCECSIHPAVSGRLEERPPGLLPVWMRLRVGSCHGWPPCLSRAILRMWGLSSVMCISVHRCFLSSGILSLLCPSVSNVKP
ncbi:uncharacterized protein LOC128805032 isoform X2 [Vidua macroura]|uniref:uncharacterized protein LOC128805032 isoform X2 n=1 Tax=Vidua macroura TaxID=187451 RepID=UPI0023A890FC|nr:uncharacterized protein LOC128805032 isoform X2 [Vidua macroura]